MKAVGVIVEYNPFHNGHAYHLQSAKEQSGADLLIAVMSGNFLQRGEPALVSKWSRTKMALMAGADIVFELPYKFATQKAETFANGAISILTASGCTSVCFGSESGSIDSFIKTAEYLQKHDDTYQESIKRNISKGFSYPKAVSLAYQSLVPGDDLIDLSKPNNILGFQYVQAILRQNSPMKAFTVSRKNADYHDEHFSSASIASATSLRKAIFSKNEEIQALTQYVPPTTYEILKDYQKEYQAMHHWEMYWPFLKFRLLQSDPSDLKLIYEVEEGLEHRLHGAAQHADSFQEFMQQIKTKRYTWTRLQRICVHILTNASKKEMLQNNQTAEYLRLLGMSEIGRSYLSEKKSSLGLPLIAKLSAFKKDAIKLDIKAARVFAMGLSKDGQSKMLKDEFSQPPIYIREF